VTNALKKKKKKKAFATPNKKTKKNITELFTEVSPA
jgi:hypothetical protein